MTGRRIAGTSSPKWHRTAEQISLHGREQHPDLARAVARFDALTDVALRMALAREVVSARSAELTLAYRNVVAVVAGYKARRDGHGAEYLMPEPCVVFVVRRKWTAAQTAATRAGSGGTAQHLPDRLLTWGPAPGGPAQRVLYAVPTDVQASERFAGAHVQSASCIRLHNAQFPLPGTLTCGMQVQGSATPPLALSAMHVLSPVPPQSTPVDQTTFSDARDGPATRGTATAWGGHLDRGNGTAFDAQLARVGDAAWFNAAFAGWKLSPAMPYVSAPDVFDTLARDRSFRILVADNHPDIGSARALVAAQFTAYVGPAFTIAYEFWVAGGLSRVALRHAELLLLTVDPASEPPISGDSGSAVLCTGLDGQTTLAGMYIACGKNDAAGIRQAYLLPAWQLFDPSLWSDLPAGTVSLRPTFQLP